jgi:hypothetical protein
MENEKEESVKMEIRRTKLAFVKLLGSTQESGRQENVLQCREQYVGQT